MTITLDHIVPTPIREKILQRSSEIWNQQVELKASDWIKVKAPSGTGKTTLHHIIWHLRKDYTGNVLYNNQPVSAISPEALAGIRQTQLSVVFQDLRLFGQLTALENIELKRRMPATPVCSTEEVQAMAERLGVAHVLHQQAATCSYGEQQRIAIIRALVQPFEWLLMDEPFSHLDQQNTAKAAALIAEACTHRKAGFLLTDLDDDQHFSYTRYLQL
ncbi:MAG: ATP-binding cassette domain-containing protein [Chitinophagaceae bacterium]|nr:ATP-binding cassette domain-containing protein [Chitinophagaceae bacterium]